MRLLMPAYCFRVPAVNSMPASQQWIKRCANSCSCCSSRWSRGPPYPNTWFNDNDIVGDPERGRPSRSHSCPSATVTTSLAAERCPKRPSHAVTPTTSNQTAGQLEQEFWAPQTNGVGHPGLSLLLLLHVQRQSS